MILCSAEHIEPLSDAHEIMYIATCLTKNFLKPLYLSKNEGNYLAYVECVDELLNWAIEFDACYQNNNYKEEPIGRNNLLIEWGSRRLKKFFAENEK